MTLFCSAVPWGVSFRMYQSLATFHICKPSANSGNLLQPPPSHRLPHNRPLLRSLWPPHRPSSQHDRQHPLGAPLGHGHRLPHLPRLAHRRRSLRGQRSAGHGHRNRHLGPFKARLDHGPHRSLLLYRLHLRSCPGRMAEHFQYRGRQPLRDSRRRVSDFDRRRDDIPLLLSA